MTALDLELETAEVATPEFEAANEAQKRRRGLLLALPAYAYLLIFFATPLLIVFVYSLATRNRFGGTDLSGWNLDSYRGLGDQLVRDVLVRSIVLAVITTVLCLVIAYPFAYWMSTRSDTVRNLMLVFVMIPFWTNFLVRNFAWRVILGREGPLNSALDVVGAGPADLLFTQGAVVLGLVYGFLPFMILPLYANIEKLDMSLLEAAADLGAKPFKTFLTVTLPLTIPGIIAGSLLVFIPATGEYVIPDLLGGGNSLMIGKLLYSEFNNNHDWPVASAVAVILLLILIIPIVLFQRNEQRQAEAEK